MTEKRNISGVAAIGGLSAAIALLTGLPAASADELASLPGIGPALAQAIIKQRAEGPFAKAEDLRKVKGIGDKLYDRLKDQITVEPVTTRNRGS